MTEREREKKTHKKKNLVRLESAALPTEVPRSQSDSQSVGVSCPVPIWVWHPGRQVDNYNVGLLETSPPGPQLSYMDGSERLTIATPPFNH